MSTDSALPDALGLALGRIVAEQRREIARELAEARAALAEARAALADFQREMRETAAVAAAEAVQDAVAGFRQPRDGRDGRDGVTLEQLEPLVEAIVIEKLEANPAPPGKDGAPGMLPIVEEWQDRVHYAGQVVTCAGGTWQAVRDTGRHPIDPADDWILLAAPGRDGADGRLPTLRGLWTADETYRALDVATLNGSAWGALCDDPGPCPGDGWRLLVARGKAGKPGEPGRPGKVEAVPVIGASIDAEGLLTIVNGDGSVVTCDLYPLLDKVRRS